MPKHFIAMSGSVGCLPDYCDVFQRQEEAVGTLADIHELSHRDKNILRSNGYVDVAVGADYAQVLECNCDAPQIHSEHSLDWGE
jgi:hypothetical protein